MTETELDAEEKLTNELRTRIVQAIRLPDSSVATSPTLAALSDVIVQLICTVAQQLSSSQPQAARHLLDTTLSYLRETTTAELMRIRVAAEGLN